MQTPLSRWNRLDPAAAAAEILPCNGSEAWARGLAELRPLADERVLVEASARVWSGVSAEDREQAFATHPRLGERHAEAASAISLAWSASEQAASAEPDAGAELARANREYEARFGRVFLLCATGRTRAEVLAALRMRLVASPAEELLEAAEQQRQITELRLLRWARGEG